MPLCGSSHTGKLLLSLCSLPGVFNAGRPPPIPARAGPSASLLHHCQASVASRLHFNPPSQWQPGFTLKIQIMNYPPAYHSQWSSVSLRIKSHLPRYSKPLPSYLSEWLLTGIRDILSVTEDGKPGVLQSTSNFQKKLDLTRRLNSTECCEGMEKGTLVCRVGMHNWCSHYGKLKYGGAITGQKYPMIHQFHSWVYIYGN